MSKISSSISIFSKDSEQSTIRPRQIINTILVASCSITAGMCLEWTWNATDVQNNDRAYYSRKYYSKILKNTLYLGMIFSAGPAAFVASLTDLKTVLFTGLSVTALGSAVIMYSPDFWLPLLCLGRILHGLGAGAVFVIVPNYASKISEPKTRSVLIGFHYLSLLIGVLLSQIINEYYVYSYMNIATICMVILNFITLFFIPDPDEYYRQNCNNHTGALNSKQKDLYRHHTDFKKRNTAKKNIQQYFMLKENEFNRLILANVILILLQQFTGFILLTSKLKCLYGTLLQMSEKIPDVLAITLIQISTCILCLLIVGVVGKKTLLFVSGFGMTVVLFLMNTIFNKEMKDNNNQWLLILILVYVVCYSIGYGPIPWILMPELCPRQLKLWTSGFIVSLYALLNLINDQYFSEYVKMILFGVDINLLMFTVVNIIGVFFSITCVPETKD